MAAARISQAGVNEELRARVAALEAENAELATQVAERVGDPPLRRRSWAWALLSTALIVLGAILAPTAVVGAWVNVSLTDTDRFVATYAPLARDPEVRSFVAAQTIAVINEKVDLGNITSDVIDGIIALGTGPKATTALEALKGPAAQGVQTLLQNKVRAFVDSDAFANVWATALRVSHTQFVAVMQNDTSKVVQVSNTGEIGIQLAPIIAEVKRVLVEQGLGFAERIPVIDRTIVVAHSDAIPAVRVGYNAATAIGVWLPLVVLLILGAGVLVARRRSRALIGAAIALAIAMVLTLAGLATGSIFFVSALSPAVLPPTLAAILFGSVTGDIQATAAAVLTIAIVLAIVAWLAGPAATPRRLRAFASSGADSIRESAEARGLTTGAVGEWMYAQRVLLRVAIAVVAAAIVLFSRPLSPSFTIWTVVIAALVIGLLEILQRPTPAVAVAPSGIAEPAIPE